MTTSKPALPTTTAHAARLCFFQPTRRPTALFKNEISTPWGSVKITGRLGQQHADVFEAICWEREKRADLEDGRIKLLVDPAAVRRRAGITSGQQFDEIVTELQTAVIEIIEPERFACSGHIVDHIDKARRADGNYLTRHNPLGGDRHLWRVELGKAFCRLVAGDVWIGYDPAPLAAIGCGIAQAVARHVKTHKQEPRGGWTLDGLIQAVQPGVKGQQLWDKRREMKASAEALRTAGVAIIGDRVHLGQKPDDLGQKPDDLG